MNEQPARLTTDPQEAAALLLAGGIAALPTETVYGLAGDATNAQAIAAIYAAKGRPQFNPLIAHVPDADAAFAHILPSRGHEMLADAFWPGPLTLLAPARAGSPVALLCRAGLPDQAVRVPAHPLMQSVLRLVGKPLAAPSANASGRISPTTPAHVQRTLGGRVPLILDGGPCARGLESTIIAFDGEVPLLLRAGAIAAEDIAERLGRLPEIHHGSSVIAPGQLASHYAPIKPLLLNQTARPHGSFMIGFGSVAGDINLSAAGDLTQAAARLFEALHQADDSVAARIAVAPVPEIGLGRAINDRLRRASVR
jgi:L-threonylcarbamoyladenylate synthase